MSLLTNSKSHSRTRERKSNIEIYDEIDKYDPG